MDRLNRIKYKYMDYEYDYNLTKEDIDWLINQVEQQQKQIQELESEITVLKNVNNSI